MTAWPDLVLAAGQYVLAALLVPTIADEDAYVPYGTSVPTAIVITAFVPAYHALGATWAMFSSMLVAGAWWGVVAAKGGKADG